LIAKRANENKLLSDIFNSINQFNSELEKPDYKYLIGSDINTISDIVFPMKPKSKFVVVLTIQSFDCGTCVDEAVFLEYLNRKYGEYILFCAVVGKIGNTAINNFKNKFSITYPFIQDQKILNSTIFSGYKGLKTIVSDKNKILRIDALTFNVKKLRNEYEYILLKYLE
jgi:thiol-disulfide isomerase/thioredoxin